MPGVSERTHDGLADTTDSPGHQSDLAVRAWPSSVAPFRLALVDERLQTLVRVLRFHQFLEVQLLGGAKSRRKRSRYAPRTARWANRKLEAECRQSCVLGVGQRCLGGIVGDGIDQTDAPRFLGVDRASGEGTGPRRSRAQPARRARPKRPVRTRRA